jgi:hypothetical protein
MQVRGTESFRGQVLTGTGGMWASLSWLDRLLPILVLLAMIIGVVIGMSS